MKSKVYSPHQGLGAYPQKGESPPQEGSHLRRGGQGGRHSPPPVKVLKKVLVVILSLSVFFALALSASAYIGYSAYSLPYNIEFNYTDVDSAPAVNVFDTVSSVVFASEGTFYSYNIQSDYLDIEVYEKGSNELYGFSSALYSNEGDIPSYVNFSASVHLGSTYFKSGLDYQKYIGVVYNDANIPVLGFDEDDFVPFPVVITYSYWSEDSHKFVNGTYDYMVTYDYLVDNVGTIYLADAVQSALVFGIGGQAGFYLDESPLIISSIHCDLPGYYHMDGDRDVAIYDVPLFNDNTMVSSSEFWGSSMFYAYNYGLNEGVDLQGVGGMLASAVGGFFDTPIFWKISLGDIMFTVIGICLVCVFLKFFAGG